MLQNIRDNTQGTMAKIIIAVICVPFVLFGIESLFGTSGATGVAEVNGEKISVQDLNEEIYLQKRRLLAQMGDNVDPSKLDDNKLKKPALDALVNRKILLQAADENGMAISDDYINNLIITNPDFQVDGRFSNDRFQSVLGGVGLTAATYKKLFERDLLLSQLSNGVASSGFMTDKEIEVNTRFTHQTRDIRYITLALDKEKESIEISDDEIRNFYDENPDKFQSEETVTAEYIELKQSDFNPQISQDELKEAFEKEVAGFVPDDFRKVSHILIEIDDDTTKEQALGKLVDIKQQLSEGKDFADLAKEYSDDFGSKEQGGLLGELNEDAFPKGFVDAAKTLTEGGVSDVVETESGLHLIKLNEFTTTQPPTFEERKAKLETELQAAKAAPAFWAAVEELKDISFNAPDLQEPAQSLKVDVKESAPVTRHGGEGVFGNPAVYNALFTQEVLNDRLNSDVIQVKPDYVVVLHVKDHAPQKLISFEESAKKARELAIAEKANQLLAEKAEKTKAEIQSGADFESLANQNGYEWQVHLGARRTSREIDRQLLNAAFKLPRPTQGKRAIESLQTASGAFIIFAVDNVKDGRKQDVSTMEVDAIKNYMAQSLGLKEFKAIESYRQAEADIERFKL